MQPSLVLVDYLNVLGVTARPGEADTPLLVDANAVLPRPVLNQLLQPITWGYAQVVNAAGRVDKYEFVVCNPTQLFAELLDVGAAPNRFGVRPSKGANHFSIVMEGVINDNRY